MTRDIIRLAVVTAIGGCLLAATSVCAQEEKQPDLLQGRAAFTDWSADRPGLRRHITPADLPAADLHASYAS